MTGHTQRLSASVTLLLCCYAAIAAAQGQLYYDTPGTYAFTVPSGVTQVSVLCTAGGGGAGSFVNGAGSAAGGGGGGTCYANNIPMVAGRTYRVIVGAGGVGAGSAGGNSLFQEINGATTTTVLSATAGQGGTVAPTRVGGLGGNCTFGGGVTWVGWGMGGNGGAQNWEAARGDVAGGGGGAGGYGAAGGRGGSGSGTVAFGGVDDTFGGGAAGGGADSTASDGAGSGCVGCAGGGGGTGPWGRGAAGFGGSPASVGGVGASSGDDGVRGRGGFPGGGAGGRVGASSNQQGGGGACRIIWGAGRTFPSTNAGDVLVGGTSTLTHRLLVLTVPVAQDGTDLSDFLRTVFDGYGLPYEIYRYNPTAPINMNSLLYTTTNPQTRVPKYSGIVVYPYLESLGFFTKSQARALEDYSRDRAVRIVRFGSDLSRFGMSLVPGGCTSADVPQTISANAPLGLSGIRSTAPLNGLGLFRCPANTVAAGANLNCLQWSGGFAAMEPCNVTPVMTQAGGVTAVTVSYPDGGAVPRRNTLVFSMDCSAFSSTCLLLGHWAVSFLTRDILPGLRRALLSTHVDDVFLSTEIYNTPGVSYRSTAADLNQHATWQSNPITPALPAGSNFRVEMAHNGHGVLLQVNDPQRLTNSALSYSCRTDPRWTNPTTGCIAPSVTGGACWALTTAQCQAQFPSAPAFCHQCNYRWQMPPPPAAQPANAIPTTYTSASWGSQALWNGDALQVNVQAETALRFFWTSHTFTHQNLNNVSQSDARQQWRLNQAFEGRMLMTLNKGLSRVGVVPPQITGLFNRGNLLELTAAGYRVATGDNTWPFLLNAQNPYHMLRTTQAFNGYDSATAPFWIMPRFATEIYFNVDDVASEEALYNAIYTGPGKAFSTPQTFAQILGREVDRVTRNILALRHDAHMFHQANLRTSGGTTGGLSLLQRWVNGVLAGIMSKVAWPVQSLKMDDLYNLFLERQRRNACNLDYQLTVDLTARRVTQVRATRQAGSEACVAPLAIPQAATVSTSATPGPPAVANARTLQANLATVGSSMTVTSTAGLAW